MKKCSLYELITLTVIFSLSFFVGCSSDKVAGTSEETNEFAYSVSSSSEEELSSSGKMSSSSSNGAQLGLKSCSSRAVSSSSYVASSSSRAASCSSVKSSSSSSDSKYGGHSSSSEKINDGSAVPKTLDDYLGMFNVEAGSFDNGILSTTIGQMQNVNSQDPAPTMSSVFDSPWPYKIGKQDISALNDYFPSAFRKFFKIISAINNETLDENCGLYMYNVYSDGMSLAYIVAEINENVIKVIDVPAGDCKGIPSDKMSRFLFYYCGELNSHAETEHVKANVDLSQKCPVLEPDDEWVNGKSPTLSKVLIK